MQYNGSMDILLMQMGIKQVLMERDGMTGIEADLEIKDIRSRVYKGEDAETILFEEYQLEPDYLWDLI